MTDSPTPDTSEAEDEGRKVVWNRTRIFMAGFAGFVLLVIVLSVFSCQPRQGTILFGICRTFLEQLVAYPPTIQPVSVEQYPRAVRIYFTQVDAFGQYKLEMLECVFMMDDQKGLQMEQALYNRRQVDKTVIDKFNMSIPSVIASEPNLDVPPPLPASIEQYR